MVSSFFVSSAFAAHLLAGPVIAAQAPPQSAQAQAQPERKIKITGIVRDERNAIPLPGIPVEVVGSGEVVYTDVDGRYTVELTAGTHELKVTMDGYQERRVSVTLGAGQPAAVDIALSMTGYKEELTVKGDAIDAASSSAEAQLSERKNNQVITDNIGSQEMRRNGDSDAASAMGRVTGLSVVDNQFVYVRGLGERYSNTTLAGSVLPTTEPDKKVVPLDMFPTGLLDSVQVAKSYSPDRSAEFAGGLVQIMPVKLPSKPVMDLSYTVNFFSTAFGEDILLSPVGSHDWLGFDNGARELPAGIPNDKIVRQGIYTPDVGYTPDEITSFGRQLENVWRPTTKSGMPGQDWGGVFGNRFGKVGVVASVYQSYKEQFLEEQRRFFRVAGDNELQAVSDYAMQTGTQKAQLGIVGNLAYEFTPSHRLSFENFYSHTGRDEGRYFQGANYENTFVYRNYRVQYIEEGLTSNGLGGEHFFRGLGSSRIDWRVNSARANRDEPDLREVLYQAPCSASTDCNTPSGAFVLADESQSGFRMFNELNDETLDATVNWSLSGTPGNKPTQFKIGFNYADRTRDFRSRRFRFIPITTQKADTGNLLFDQTLPPEELYTPANIGFAFRFNEETRPVDAYDGAQTTTSAFGMMDMALSATTRLITGARVEHFDQEVNTFDPFGLFVRTVQASNNNTDVFPSVNFLQALRANTNLRLSYSTTVNRPEFRELAEFEFTDVVGSRAVRGNPDLTRALIHNVDSRWERFGNGRSVVAASMFYKYFDKPIERVVIGGAQPLVTFQNSDKARNFGVELELGQQLGANVYVNANYTWVDSKITLLPEQQSVQTSLERPLAGQSKNIFNVMAEHTFRGFATRLLFNYAGDRISDVGSNGAPDIVEEGRGALDLVFSQRIYGFAIRLTLENLTDADYLFTQGSDEQRLYNVGRTIKVSIGYNLFR